MEIQVDRSYATPRRTPGITRDARDRGIARRLRVRFVQVKHVSKSSRVDFVRANKGDGARSQTSRTYSPPNRSFTCAGKQEELRSFRLCLTVPLMELIRNALFKGPIITGLQNKRLNEEFHPAAQRTLAKLQTLPE